MSTIKVERDGIDYFVEEIDIKAIRYERMSQLNVPVTFKLDGTPHSFFNDDNWDYSPYREKRANHSKAEFTVDFKKVANSRLRGELKMACFALFGTDFPYEKNAKMIRSKMKLLTPLANELDQEGVDSFSQLNSFLLEDYLNKIKGRFSASTLSKKLSALNIISKLDLPELKFVLPIKANGFSFNETIESLAKKYSVVREKQQTLYIPTHILESMLENALVMFEDAETEFCVDGIKMTKLDAINLILKERWNQIRRSYESHKREDFVDSISYQNAITKWRNDKFGTLSKQLKDVGLGEILTDERNAKHDIFGYLGRLFASSVITILSFSGMRYDELKTMRRKDAFITKTYKDTRFHYMVAFESKITGGEEVDYISAPIARKAVEIINKLHQPARDMLSEYRDNEFLMFSHDDCFLPKFKSYNAVESNLSKFVEHFGIKISVDDIAEIKAVNQKHIGLGVGSLWPLTSHQFRRTLVVNFISHKRAKVEALKQQVKHMFEQMTLYYGKNAEAAQVLGLKADKDLMSEITDAVTETNISIFKRIYKTDEKLAGIKGESLMEEREGMSALTEEEIRSYVETGIWNVTLSPYGYCTKGNDCDKSNVIDPSVCSIKCETTIITIENAIEWRKLYWKNTKLMQSGLIDDYKGLAQQMEMQNRIACKIMGQFNLPVSGEFIT